MTTRPLAGRYLVYERQNIAIKSIVENIASQQESILMEGGGIGKYTPVVFIAPLSFGKTLVGIRLLMQYSNANNIVCLIAPTSAQKVWDSEFRKYYPELLSSRKLEDRRVLFYNARNKEIIDRYPGEQLGGRIIVASAANEQIMSKLPVGLVVVDEYHKHQNKYINKHRKLTYPMVLLGASSVKTNFACSNIVAKINLDHLPQVVDTVFMADEQECGLVALEHLYKQNDRHICLLAQNSYECSKLIKAAQERGRIVHDYTTRSIRALQEFTTNGGILVSTVRILAEGLNLNMCSCMIAVVPSNDIIGNITLKFLQQLRGRIVRQSSIHKVVKVTMVASTPRMIARALLTRVNCTGYDILENCANFDRRVAAILEVVDTISAAEMLMLLAQPYSTSTQYVSGPPTLSAGQLVGIALA